MIGMGLAFYLGQMHKLPAGNVLRSAGYHLPSACRVSEWLHPGLQPWLASIRTRNVHAYGFPRDGLDTFTSVSPSFQFHLDGRITLFWDFHCVSHLGGLINTDGIVSDDGLIIFPPINW